MVNGEDRILFQNGVVEILFFQFGVKSVKPCMAYGIDPRGCVFRDGDAEGYPVLFVRFGELCVNCGEKISFEGIQLSDQGEIAGEQYFVEWFFF